MSANFSIKRTGTIALIVLVLAACVYMAVVSPKFGFLVSGPGLLFVLAAGVALVLMSFSGNEISEAFKHAVGASGKGRELQRSAYFWEAMARNFWMVGVLGSLITFIIGLGSSAGGIQGISTRMTNSYLSTIYGMILAVICAAPALKLSGKLDVSVNTAGQEIGRANSAGVDKTFGITHFIGYALFILCLGGVMISAMSSFTPDSPLKPQNVFLNWPSLLIVVGGTLLFVLFIGSQALGRSLTLSFALTGLIGTLVGYYMLLQGFLSHNIAEIASGMTFIISACFLALLGMIVLGAPLGDRMLKNAQSSRQGALNRIAWFIFPLISILFLTLTFILVITPIKRPM